MIQPNHQYFYGKGGVPGPFFAALRKLKPNVFIHADGSYGFEARCEGSPGTLYATPFWDSNDLHIAYISDMGDRDFEPIRCDFFTGDPEADVAEYLSRVETAIKSERISITRPDITIYIKGGKGVGKSCLARRLALGLIDEGHIIVEDSNLAPGDDEALAAQFKSPRKILILVQLV